jgi:hypothetical protein
MPVPEPLCLSDAQITTVMQLARPLQPAQRTVFLEMLAAKLNGQHDIGDGQLFRVCRELQRKVLGAPIERRGRPRKTA